jgi:hypothetical protein
MDTKKTTQKRTGLEIFDSAASGLQQLKQRLETLGLEWSGTPSIEIFEMSGRAYVKTKLTLVMPVDPQLPVRPYFLAYICKYLFKGKDNV